MGIDLHLADKSLLDYSKHFKNPMIKMYITINDVEGERRIDQSYPIKNFDSSEEVAVASMLSQ